jgi:hypothetical protein
LHPVVRSNIKFVLFQGLTQFRSALDSFSLARV